MTDGNIVLRDVNQCIYCHTKEGKLTQEHIVPFGLNGKHVLFHASCAECARITSRFEMTVLRETFISARKHLKLKSRRKKQWNTPNEAFSVLIFPLTEAPTHITGKNYSGGVHVIGTQIVYLKSGKGKSETIISGNDFELMLAKIALGFAVGKYGIEAFEEIYVIPAILGLKNDIGRWVGMSGRQKPSEPQTVYVVQTENIKSEVICSIRLFSMFIVPEYLVVVGKLNENALI